jgi:hypothetical protein
VLLITLFYRMGVEGGGGGGGDLESGRCGLCIKITKWLPVVFIMCVISWSYYAFVVQLCIMTMAELWLQILSLFIYHISLGLFLWAYFQTIFTNSNRVPRKFKIPQSELSIN